MASDNKDSRSKWTDKANFAVSFALLVCAIVALAVSYWQWESARDQLEFAKQSALESGQETRAALTLSRRAAAAAEAQALATINAVAASKRTAAAAESQAGATMQAVQASARLANAAEAESKLTAAQLALTKQPKIFITAEYKGFTGNKQRLAHFTIVNDSSYTIENINSEQVSEIISKYDRDNPWRAPSTLAIYRLAPGEKRLVEMIGPVEGSGESYKFASGDAYFVFAMRLTFKDSDGLAHVEEQCIYLDWDFDMRPQACVNTKSNIILRRIR